jgi:hypothetical protein
MLQMKTTLKRLNKHQSKRKKLIPYCRTVRKTLKRMQWSTRLPSSSR